MRADIAREMRPGMRFTLNPKRAEAYGEPRGFVYTVKSVRPDPHYSKVWVTALELPEGANTFRNDDLAKLVDTRPITC